VDLAQKGSIRKRRTTKTVLKTGAAKREKISRYQYFLAEPKKKLKFT